MTNSYICCSATQFSVKWAGQTSVCVLKFKTEQRSTEDEYEH